MCEASNRAKGGGLCESPRDTVVGGRVTRAASFHFTRRMIPGSQRKSGSSRLRMNARGSFALRPGEILQEHLRRECRYSSACAVRCGYTTEGKRRRSAPLESWHTPTISMPVRPVANLPSEHCSAPRTGWPTQHPAGGDARKPAGGGEGGVLKKTRSGTPYILLVCAIGCDQTIGGRKKQCAQVYRLFDWFYELC